MNPFEHWLNTDTGKKCSDFYTLKESRYLENRLFLAFWGGMLDEHRRVDQLQKTIDWYEQQLRKLKTENQEINHQLQQLQGQPSEP